MRIHADGNWWKDLFDEIYLMTDARTVCDDELTSREVDFLEQTLLRDKTQPILDLCGGQGRHSMELSRRGFLDVTVLDYSDYLVRLGRRKARRENLRTNFFQGDARKTGLPPGSYRFILILASSFGYFAEEEENRKILQEAFRLLAPGGTLLLDLPDRETFIRNFQPISSHRVNEDITVCRQRELGEDIVYSRERVTSRAEGCIRDRTYCIRLYSPEKISGMIQSTGFSSVDCKKDFMSRESQGDYGCMTNRMMITARK